MSGSCKGSLCIWVFQCSCVPCIFARIVITCQLGCWFETELLDVSIHSGLWVGRSDHGFHERSHVLGDSRTRVSSAR